LLSIPIIILSGAYKSVQLVEMDGANWMDMALGAFFSAISAFVCIHYFLKFINNIGMMPFVVYRLVLGGFLLFWSLS
jgi:undecaprenyl-diphosphatase